MKRHVLMAICASGLLVGSCAPRISALVNDNGPERSLVEIQGTNLQSAEVIWDAGQPGEAVLPGSLQGARMFTVPPGAAPGPHPVAARNSRGTSSPVTYTVTPQQPFGAPRIDRVTFQNVSFSGSQVSLQLYVQGANIDIGAVARIGANDIATTSHRGLRNELYGADPSVMGYPIYHYVALLAVPGPQAAGSTINLVVRNLDGQISQPFPVTLPTSLADLDSDGDNLLDSWETAGFDADGDGIIDVDLAALGANPHRPDILVEVDIMQGLDNPPIPTNGLIPGTFDLARHMFRAAPVLNPGGEEGINLILDTSGTVPFSQTVGFGTILPGPPGTTNYTALKAANFDNARRGRIYHYAVWANALVGGFSGVSDVDFGGSGSGDDFLVTFDDFPLGFQTRRSQVETFVHELGHNLGQRHGGDTHSTRKPNYWSVMSYAWQLRSGRNNATRRMRTTCAPIYWADPTALEANGAAPILRNAIVDYSHGMGPVIVENTNSLNEPIGVCGVPVYWNTDLDAIDIGLSLDADDNGNATETLNDHSNWRSLDLRGPQSNGTIQP